MTDTPEQPPELEIKSDEDWKERVKAEDARLDAKRAAENEGQPSTAKEQSPPPTESGDRQPPVDAAQLPKPEFSTLVGLFSTQAMVSLGLMGHPEDGKTEVQLPLARHFIDMLGVLDEKTKGNLTDAEAKLLERTLHDLRMVYLERSRAE